MFELMLYTSLSILIIGLIYKVYTWSAHRVGASSELFSPAQRAFAAAGGVLRVVLSPKALILAKVFFLDVLFQRKILKESLVRWLMHMAIFYGFMLLLLMHALGRIVTANLFPDYASTANPFYFLRSFFGVIALVGLGIAFFRRFVWKTPRLATNRADKYAIFILAAVMISGILLEGLKITSYSDFTRMAEEYGGFSGEWEGDEDFQALETYWVQDFGVVSPHLDGTLDAEVLQQGKEIHEMNCQGCHASPEWAFAGNAAAGLMRPFALGLDRLGGVNFLWYVHIVLCLFGLAYLPFSKIFHVFATPASLLANAVMEKERSRPANIVTRQVIELDACTHCGTCSLRCSAVMAFEALGNAYILPSEKMAVLKKLIAGKSLGRREMRAVLEGVYICTNCDRCTVSCPSGINLRDMWFNVREELIKKYRPGPIVLSQLSFARGLARDRVPRSDYPKPLEETREILSAEFDALMKGPLSLPLGRGMANEVTRANTYSYCFGCQNCTTVCPVVGSYEDPQQALGLLPHQIMWCLGSGLVEPASDSAMVWNCVTCYQCQEHCPQNVQVTDLFYELKNWALKRRAEEKGESTSASKAA